jgi:hypothetical protein
MNPLANIRQRQIPWTHRVLGLFVVLWLNIALQACAMALTDEHQHNCPQCPTAQPQEIPPQGSHESYDKALEGASCNADASQCAYSDDYNYDGRTVQVKAKDAPSDVPVAIAPAIVALSLADTVSVSPGPHDPSRQPGVPPSLNILYCVYLD